MKRSKRVTKHNEAGVAFVEMSITLLVSFFLMMAILDIAIVLKRYVSITRIAYEGVRIASDSSQLSPQTFTTETNHADYTHAELHRRIGAIITHYFSSSEGFNIVTTMDSDDDLVIVTVTSPPLDLFNSFLEQAVVVSTKVEGPYLYINDDGNKNGDAYGYGQ